MPLMACRIHGTCLPGSSRTFHSIVRGLLGLALALSITASVRVAEAGNFTNSYDQRGRLVGAVDNTITTGTNGIEYSYDAVDNITAMTSTSATSTSVFTVSPLNAPPNTNVTIYGDGFNSSSVVKFGTTPVSINSYTLSTIVVTVPSLSPGTISVYVNSASTPFQVTAQ